MISLTGSPEARPTYLGWGGGRLKWLGMEGMRIQKMFMMGTVPLSSVDSPPPSPSEGPNTSSKRLTNRPKYNITSQDNNIYYIFNGQ